MGEGPGTQRSRRAFTSLVLPIRRQVPLDQSLLRPMFLPRYVAVATLALGAVIFGGLRSVDGLLILVVGSAVNAVVHFGTKVIGSTPRWMHLLDLAGCLFFAWFDPALTVPAAMVALAVVALAATVSGPLPATATALIGTVALGMLRLMDRPTPTMAVVLGFAASSTMIAITVGQLAAIGARVRNRLDTVVSNLDATVWVQQYPDGPVTFINRRSETLLGWTDEEWFTPGFWRANIHPDDAEATIAMFEESVAGGADHELNYRFRDGSGGWRHLQDRITTVVDDQTSAVFLQGMSIDITDRVHIEERVSQFADIVDRIDLALIVLQIDQDRVLRLRAANPASEELVQRPLTGLIGLPLAEAFPTLAGARLEDRLVQVVERAAPLLVDDVVVRAGGAPPRVVTLRAFPLPNRSIGISLFDVTEAVAASEALRRQALYDGLTGLPNRRLLDQELQRAVHESPDRGESVALLMMDLDQFKEVNDALGHHVGDQLLRGIGERLASVIDDALIARLGGDEFAILLVGMVDHHQAVAVAERVRAVLTEPFLVDDVRLQSNASIGIAVYPDQASDASTLIQRADVAMYVAKRTGSGVSVYAPTEDRSSVERLTLIGDLPDAITANQFELHFQPFVDIRSGRTVRVEALVRWRHPVLGLLPPVQFIELAGLSGAIQPLTRWVLDEGARAAKVWRTAGHDVGLAVNLSVRNLYDPGLLRHLEAAIETAGLSPSDLVLELTETELMDDPSLAREMFEAFGDLGIHTSVDDFGTGYSSLTFLRDLPLQEVKIDKSFVGEMHRRSDEFTIVRSMIDLGHNLGLEVVAEGVEHATDLELLRRLGCDLAQGYHFSRPLPLPELLLWLEEHGVPRVETEPLGSSGR